MSAEALDFYDGYFDVAVCSLGLMFMADPGRALVEMRRVLRPGGRLVVSVWGAGEPRGWVPFLSGLEAAIGREVAPDPFALGRGDRLVDLITDAGFGTVETRRTIAPLRYAVEEAALEAAWMGAPPSAWTNAVAGMRECLRAGARETLEAWRDGDGYAIPCEIVTAAAVAPAAASSATAGARAR
jgi:SAM-dependent methyltransferase